MNESAALKYLRSRNFSQLVHSNSTLLHNVVLQVLLGIKTTELSFNRTEFVEFIHLLTEQLRYVKRQSPAIGTITIDPVLSPQFKGVAYPVDSITVGKNAISWLEKHAIWPIRNYFSRRDIIEHLQSAERRCQAAEFMDTYNPKTIVVSKFLDNFCAIFKEEDSCLDVPNPKNSLNVSDVVWHECIAFCRTPLIQLIITDCVCDCVDYQVYSCTFKKLHDFVRSFVKTNTADKLNCLDFLDVDHQIVAYCLVISASNITSAYDVDKVLKSCGSISMRQVYCYYLNHVPLEVICHEKDSVLTALNSAKLDGDTPYCGSLLEYSVNSCLYAVPQGYNSAMEFSDFNNVGGLCHIHAYCPNVQYKQHFIKTRRERKRLRGGVALGLIRKKRPKFNLKTWPKYISSEAIIIFKKDTTNPQTIGYTITLNVETTRVDAKWAQCDAIVEFKSGTKQLFRMRNGATTLNDIGSLSDITRITLLFKHMFVVNFNKSYCWSDKIHNVCDESYFKVKRITRCGTKLAQEIFTPPTCAHMKEWMFDYASNSHQLDFNYC